MQNPACGRGGVIHDFVSVSRSGTESTRPKKQASYRRGVMNLATRETLVLFRQGLLTTRGTERFRMKNPACGRDCVIHDFVSVSRSGTESTRPKKQASYRRGVMNLATRKTLVLFRQGFLTTRGTERFRMQNPTSGGGGQNQSPR